MSADNILAFPTPPIARPGSRLDAAIDAAAINLARYVSEQRAGLPSTRPPMSDAKRAELRADLAACEREPALPAIVERHIKRLAQEVCDRAFRMAAD